MADGRHIEKTFSAPYWPINAKFRSDMKNHADIGHVTKMANFENSRWRTAAILKIALSPYLSRELSDFDHIWYTDANFHSEDGDLTKRSKFHQFMIADGRHIENRFLAVSLRHIGWLMRNLDQRWRITCRYRARD